MPLIHQKRVVVNVRGLLLPYHFWHFPRGGEREALGYWIQENLQIYIK